MKKLVIPVAAALALSVAPAWADSDTSVRTEERVEQKRSPFGDTETTRSVESRTESDGDERSAHSVQREETVNMGGLGTVQKKTEKRVETSED